MDEFTRPVILLAFANAVEQPLPKLMEEERGLRQILEQAAAHPLSDGRIGLCEPVILSRATTADILDAFQKYRNRIAIFHYAGHANGYALLLESATGAPALADADGLAGFLAQQTGLELVFLNGCATQDQAQGLLEAGVEVVIATAQEIKDTVARDFALRFYQGLVSNAAILTAFNEAESGITTVYGDGVRHLYTTAAARRKKNPPAGSPWKLFYPTAQPEIVKHWTLGQLVQDPLFGLPSLPDLDLPDEPYRHLDYFRREHAHIFFGRGRQIRALYTAIQDRESDPLLLLYGQSGIGKSSFLAAGLLPRLEGDYQVAYCRRDQSKGLLGVLSEVLTVDAEAPSLAHAWHWLESAQSKPLIIVIDQVEEFYTRPNHDLPQEMTAFLDAVQAIFGERAHRPQGKLILGFRKEWLAEITKLLRERALPFTDLFLERLDRRGIMEAVTGVARVARLQRRYHLTIEAGLPEEIADDLVVDPGSAIATTLQILLTKLWARAKDRSYAQPIFDRILYHALRSKGLLLSDFFDQQMQTLQTLQPEVVASGLALDLLAYHTTEQDTAEERSLADLRAVYHHRTAILPGLVRHCQDLYLLTDSAQNEPGKAASSRLAHDTLAPLVQQRFDTSDRPGQRAWRILENRSAEWQNGSKGAPLDERDLALVEQGTQGMRAWTPAEQKLVHASRRARQRQQAIRVSVIMLGMIAVLAIIWQRNVAILARDEAQRNESTALAAQALEQLAGEPLASAALAVTGLPFPSPRPYVPHTEFAYTEAIQNSWEDQRIQASTFLTTKTQFARQAGRLAVGGKGLTLITLPSLQVIPLRVPDQQTWDVAWSKDGVLLSYNSAALQIWRPLPSGAWTADQPVVADADKGNITCAAWHPDGEQIAVCEGKLLRLWRPGAPLETVHEFTATVSGDISRPLAHWSPNGSWLAAWDSNNMLAVWDGAHRFTADPAPAHAERIWDIAWSSNEQYLVTIAGDGLAKVWSLADLPVTGLRLTASIPLTVAGQASSNLIQAAGVKFVAEEQFVTWGFGNGAKKWNVAGEAIQSYGAEEGMVAAVELDKEGDSTSLYLLMESGAVMTWDLNGDIRRTSYSGHAQPVLAIAPYAGYLATAGLDGVARVWNATTGIELAALRGHLSGPTAGRRDILDLFWLDAQHLATVGVDGTVRKWRFVNGSDPWCSGQGALQPPACYGLSRMIKLSEQRIVAAAWVSDTAVVGVDSKYDVQLWREGQPVRALLPPAEQRRVWLNPDGTTFFSVEAKTKEAPQVGALWQVSDAAAPLITLSEPISAVHWIGQNLLLSRPAQPPLMLDGHSGATLAELADSGARYTAVQLDNAQIDNAQLATVDTKGLLRIWRMPSGIQQAEWPLLQAGMVTAIAWLAQGNQLITATDRGVVTLWDRQAQHAVWSVHPLTGTVNSLALSPDEQWLAVAIQKAFFVIELATGQLRQEHYNARDTVAGVQWVARPAWSQLLPTTSADMPFFLYLSRRVRQTTDPQLLLMTWGGDGEVHFWHRDPLVEVLRLREEWYWPPYRSPITVAAISPNRAGLLMTGDSGNLRIWQLWLDQPETLLNVLTARRTLP